MKKKRQKIKIAGDFHYPFHDQALVGGGQP